MKTERSCDNLILLSVQTSHWAIVSQKITDTLLCGTEKRNLWWHVFIVTFEK